MSIAVPRRVGSLRAQRRREVIEAYLYLVPTFVGLILNRGLRGVVLLRSLYFLPVISSTVAVSLVWGWLYNQQFGLINYLLSLVGLSGPAWLADTRSAMPAVI